MIKGESAEINKYANERTSLVASGKSTLTREISEKIGRSNEKEVLVDMQNFVS